MVTHMGAMVASTIKECRHSNTLRTVIFHDAPVICPPAKINGTARNMLFEDANYDEHPMDDEIGEMLLAAAEAAKEGNSHPDPKRRPAGTADAAEAANEGKSDPDPKRCRVGTADS